MAFVCCGVKQSLSDPETYLYIELDLIKKFTKKEVKGQKVAKETVETLTCIKNHCRKVQIKRYGAAKLTGRKKILEVIELKDNIKINKVDTKVQNIIVELYKNIGLKFNAALVPHLLETNESIVVNPASEFLEATKDIRTYQATKCPIKTVPFGKNIPLVFGKAISGTEQRKRYEGDKYWCNKYESVELIHGIEQSKWVPDIFESEVKVYQQKQ